MKNKTFKSDILKKPLIKKKLYLYLKNLDHTLRSPINVQSVINVQGDKFSKKNKRTGWKSS